MDGNLNSVQFPIVEYAESISSVQIFAQKEYDIFDCLVFFGIAPHRIVTLNCLGGIHN